jgi:hypothetical protein
MNTRRCGRYCLVAGVSLMISAAVMFVSLQAFPIRRYPSPMRVTCINNLKQIGLAFKTWALDNSNCYPFNLNTNAGGTRELCAVGADGFDSNAVRHLQVMSNELSTPLLLVCPKDKSKTRAADFGHLTRSNITYRFHSGTNINEDNPAAVLAVCPMDGNTLYCDGSVNSPRGEQSREEEEFSGLEIAEELYSPVAGGVGALLSIIGLVLKLRR